MTENAEHPLLKRATQLQLVHDVLQDYVVKGEGRRRHMSPVFSLCACIYGRYVTERSNVANSVIWLREKCV